MVLNCTGNEAMLTETVDCSWLVQYMTLGLCAWKCKLYMVQWKVQYSTSQCIVQCTVKYSRSQCIVQFIVQYITVCSTVQYNTVQDSTVQDIIQFLKVMCLTLPLQVPLTLPRVFSKTNSVFLKEDTKKCVSNNACPRACISQFSHLQTNPDESFCQDAFG